MKKQVCKNYKEAVELLGARKVRKVCNNTRILRVSEHIIQVVLHSTPIVSYYDTGEVVLNSGGWRTATTKSRINVYQDKVSVIQRRGAWYVSNGGPLAVDFVDGMIV